MRGTSSAGLSMGLMLVLAGGVAATDIAVVPRKLVVVDKLVAAGKAKTVFVLKDPAVTKGGGTDPDQISVRFDVTYRAAAGEFTLPSGASASNSPGWVVNSDTVAKYVNQEAPTGPTEAKVAAIKPGKLLKLVGKGLGDTDLDMLTVGAPSGVVYTAYCVTNGAEENCHCSVFNGCLYKPMAGNTGAKLVCKAGLGDSWCKAACGDDELMDLGLTVLDMCTNLEWAKKDTAVGSGADAGNLHDVDNLYSWAGRCTLDTSVLCQPNPTAAATCAAQTAGALGCGECAVGEGTCDVDPFSDGAITTVWDWINQVNTAGYAGHSDWRLPTSAGTAAQSGGSPTGEAAELESIADFGEPGCEIIGNPCIDPIFGPTPGFGSYWSASTIPVNPGTAWLVDFNFGDPACCNSKSVGHSVRAVRPGS